MVHPVVLSGGSGTRLWPLSRRDYPKQFSSFDGTDSLFQATLRRLSGEGFAPPVVLTQNETRFLAAEQMAALGLSQASLVLEPVARNTGPAILVAALYLDAMGAGDEVMVVAPSDHTIADMAAFQAALSQAVAAAEQGGLLCLGITPDRPETGYGYLELDTAPVPGVAPEVLPVRRFVEKPDAVLAQEWLSSGRYLWNAGIFVARVRDMIEAFAEHAPAMVGPCRVALARATQDLGFLRLDETSFAQAPSDSIDYAVMERAEGVCVVPMSCGWSDLGSWDALWRTMEHDAQEVACAGPVTAKDCTRSLLRSEPGGPRLAAIGLSDLMVVATADAVLVADRRESQAVKALVTDLAAEGVAEATEFRRSYRPWGWYETLALGPRFQVKQIVVKPKGRLSLQSHIHRAEHWVVVAGSALVTVEDTEQLISENTSIYVPLGARHRLENPGLVELRLIEVQTGSYFGEDDIIRYDDVYNRS